MEELLKEYKDLQSREFILQMCDHWSREDFNTSHQYHERQTEIENELQEKYGVEIQKTLLETKFILNGEEIK